MVTPCALIAAFNEERTIAEVVTGTRRHVADVFVVDDGSADATAERAREAGAIVVRQARNAGKGSAIRAGLAHVLAGPYSHVLLLDGDLQHDPAEIPKLLERAASGGELVLAERDFSPEAMPASRYYSNVIGAWILSRFIGAPVRDSQSGFRLISTALLRRVPLTATGYELETEMLIKLVRAGARLDRVTVNRLHYAGARSHMRPVRDTFRTCMLALAYRYFPWQP